jgi:hypothetical protein
VSPDPNELEPNVGSTDSNELTPNVNNGSHPLPPPQQVNEIQNNDSHGAKGSASSPGNSTASASQSDDTGMASSKHKKKKGLKKLIPF